MAECEKFTDLTSGEIEMIISEATPVNKIRATAWGVSVFKGNSLFVRYRDLQARVHE